MSSVSSARSTPYTLPYSLLVPLFIRSLGLLLPHTFFQPDEFFQAFEPAHKVVFGFGHLTWEWRDLPLVSSAAEALLPDNGSAIGRGFWAEWWEELVVGGRMRGWIWPSIFVGVYKILQAFKLDQTDLIVIAPRLVGVLVASMTDWYTYHLATKVLGPGASASALFLSLTSLFNAHILPRALSTSSETLLTTMALYYFPLPSLSVFKSSLSGNLALDPKGQTKAQAIVPEQPETQVSKEQLNYIAMDRNDPIFGNAPPSDNLALSICVATIALCIRPTTLPLWAYLGVDLLRRIFLDSGFRAALRVTAVAAPSGLTTLALSTYVDYAFTGRLYFPILTFTHQNILQNISSFYGSTNKLYHLTQSIPIMLFPIWWWWARGFIAALLPTNVLPASLTHVDRPEGLKLLARAITFAIAVLSLSPHSEWRFLHPFLPPLLLFAIPAFATKYRPTLLGRYPYVHSFRQYTRIPKFPFYLTLFTPLLPYLYLNIFHGRAQVGVMDVLRRGELGEITSLVALMPCHSTPWMSALHQDVGGWFVTCEPPLGVDPRIHRTQQDLFYQAPVAYLDHVFPYPPVQLHDISKSSVGAAKPSHVLLFGELNTRHDESASHEFSVGDALSNLGYSEVWYGWNGFDILQDEDKRRGGVRVWRLS